MRYTGVACRVIVAVVVATTFASSLRGRTPVADVRHRGDGTDEHDPRHGH
jgi:hypothetical protein